MKLSHAGVELRHEKRDALLAGQLLVVDLVSESPALKTRGIVLNISKGGMAVQTFRPLGQGKITEIQLSLPRFSSSAGRGVVEWEKQGGVAGICFLPPLKTLAELRQWVQRYPSNQETDSALPLLACRSNPSASEFDTTLHLFAHSAMALTGASGAAIALGNIGGMECRASIGSAPDLGAQLHPDSGISGHSLRTGSVILCNDLRSDSRANAAAVLQMDIRSLVIVPIALAEEAEKVVGLLEVFSPNANHFDERHIQQLQPLMNILAEAIKDETDNNTPDLLGASAPAIAETVEPEELSPHTQPADRLHTVAMLVALLVLIIAVALFTPRLRTRSSGNANSPISAPHNAQQPDAVAATKAIIGFSPSVISQKVGKTFNVDVVVKDARNLSSVPVQILYDPQKLQFITVTSGGLLDRDGQTAALVQRVNSSAGRINVSISRPSTAPGISGDGVVFTLAFAGKASGLTRLRFEQTGLRNTSAKAISVDSSEAVVNISNATTPAANTQNHGPTETRSLPSAPTALSRSTPADRSVPQSGVDRSTAIPK